MTDKQIIEHELLYEGLDWSVGVDGMFINPKQIPYTNCLYELALACDSKSKQLKRKEQECKNNKIAHQMELDIYNQECLNLQEELKEALEQLDQLKVENDEYYLFIEKLCDYAGLECDNEEQAMRTLLNLASQMNKARWIIDRYKQTLTEIKEIAQNVIKNVSDRCIETTPMYYIHKQILQKISECEVGDDNI